MDKILPSEGKDFLVAGDLRCPEQPGLVMIHTVFFLEHNRLGISQICSSTMTPLCFRIARALSESNKMKTYIDSKTNGNEQKKDDIYFRLARKILVASYQHIIYAEYLPVVLGNDYMTQFDLWSKLNEESNYNEETDPTLTNEFSTFAYRSI